ncbi:MAG TPA: 50S ribosomal protein L25/general stress protein Ctc [Gemmatimonadaceae bacterium]|jgi:large subunit ribosomal protein L25|nr:50S ribosomal protein L25/general stress protein Ctc [Gemmatimonadaceae bacterium]
MATANLSAKVRSDRGTGVARKLRQGGEVPAIIYGHSRQPQSLAINTRELEKLLDHVAAASTVIELSIDGRSARTLIREIQRHPVKRSIIHVDFQELVAGEKVTVSIPLVFIGSAEGVRGGGILDQVMHELRIHVDPSNIPNHVDVDVTPLAIGHSIHVRELNIPAGVEVLDEENATVCTVSPPRASETPAAGVAVVPEAAAEPELIRKPKEGEEEGGEES